MLNGILAEELDDYYLTECDSDCFECGLKYNGASVQPPIDPFEGGPKDCQDLCEVTEGCNYFTWRSYRTTPRRVCILKRGKGTPTAKETGISGSAYRCRNPGEYIVDNSGLYDSDYTSIQACVNDANPGDACLVREGRYHEVITIVNKTDLTIKGFQNERPIIDGTVDLINNGNGGEWKFNSNTGVCRGRISHDVFQLFLNGDMMTNARWPDALWSDKTVFQNEYWGHSTNDSTRGVMIDNGQAGLAASGLNMTGAMAVLNVGSFNTFVKEVQWHEPNTDSFTYDDDFGNINFKPAHNQYYLDSSLELLNQAGEWHYDMSTRTLRFIPPNNGAGCPSKDSGAVKGRVIDYAITITKSKSILLKNMDFFAANLMAEGTQKKVDEVSDITIDSLNFDYPSSSKRMLKDHSVPKHTKLIAKGFGEVNVINCKFFGAEGSALQYWGAPAKIHNNMFSWNDWSGQMGLVANGGFGTVYSSPTSKDEEFIGNTLYYNGASAGYRSGKTPIVSDNMVIGQADGEIMNDGSGIQIQTKCQIDATVERNWVYDSPKYGIRFDHSPGNLGDNGTMSKNVVWNTKGIMVKGDDHIVDGNLAIDNVAGYEDAASLLVIHILRQETDIHNANTLVTNNLATKADGGINMQMEKPYGRWDVAGITSNNYAGSDLSSLLVDTDNNDFRPISSDVFPDSGRIGVDTGDDMGPYPPKGQTITQYDIPGYKTLHKATHPIPGDNAVVTGRDALMFRPGFRCSSHNVYVSSADGDLPSTSTSLSQNANGRMNNALMINGINAGEYQWRVDCVDEESGDVMEGDLWKFTVQPLIFDAR